MLNEIGAHFAYVLRLGLQIGHGPLGMVLFPLLLILALVAGLKCRGRLPGWAALSLIGIVFVGLFVWQTLFFVNYPAEPGTVVPVVAGWNLTSFAQAYADGILGFPELAWNARAERLLAGFNADPELVWEGTGLVASRAAGALLICGALFLLAALLPSRSLRQQLD